MRVLVDTNVLLDVLLRQSPFYLISSVVWQLAETRRIDAVVCAVSVTNVHYIARKRLGQAVADQGVRLILAAFKIADVDHMVLDSAVLAGNSDFEDAVQAASGAKAGAIEVITRDMTGFSKGPLVRISPDAFVRRYRTFP